MELKDLRHFLAIAREKTISGAADVLHVTQPTLSRQMMELEAELGKKLFVRGNRKITLTDEGLFLQKRAQEVLSLIAKTEAEFVSGDEQIIGKVYIGGGETAAIRIFARVMKKLRASYPQITYNIVSSNAEGTMEQLDNGLVDFGLFIEPVDLSKYDFMRLKEKHVYGILMRKDSPLAAHTSIRPAHLAGLPLLCPNRSLVANEFAAWLGDSYSLSNIIITYNLLYNASVMVEEGLGYALCIDQAIHLSEDSRFCFRALEPKLEVGVAVAWKKYQTFSKAAGAFLESLRHEAG